MTNVDLAKYKRLVQGLFDPEPRNDDAFSSPIWCLGVKYTSILPVKETRSKCRPKSTSPSRSQTHDTTRHRKGSPTTPEEHQGVITHHKDNSTEETSTWPIEFLRDCESRMWFTYRSGFPPITRSPDASMTLAVRLRSLADKQGFTSDTGWGCMIRSGQCLLANALSILWLGRG